MGIPVLIQSLSSKSRTAFDHVKNQTLTAKVLRSIKFIANSIAKSVSLKDRNFDNVYPKLMVKNVAP
jgi:hypothetical protein